MNSENITIEKAANGYIVRVATNESFMRGVAPSCPHVFESFDSMAKWLEIRLEGKKQPSTTRDEGDQ